jgi:hypothetical protein
MNNKFNDLLIYNNSVEQYKSGKIDKKTFISNLKAIKNKNIYSVDEIINELMGWKNETI